MPGHRFYYREQWNILDLSDRIEELLAHIAERSSAILGILEPGPLTPVEIARKYFDPRVLKGPGMHMAMNEIIDRKFIHKEFI